MRLLMGFILAIGLCVACIFFLAHRTPNEWASEPTVYLGVKLGQPLAASIPDCRSRDDRRLCFDGSFIANEPDPVSGTMPVIEEGIVANVITNYRPDAEDMIREDLKKKFGEPQSTAFETDFWKGKVITIALEKPGKDGIGHLVASLVAPPNSTQPPHVNPF